MYRKLSLVLMVVLSLSLAACGKSTPDGGNNGNTLPTDTGSTLGDGEGSNAWGTGYSAEDLASRFGIMGNPLNYTTLYFEYNSSSLDERSRIIATAHARHLSQLGGSTNVTLEGHADERGSRDYNLALGERRGQAVGQLMGAEGAASPMQTISYGEERPANSAHNESAWQEYRRVEISY